MSIVCTGITCNFASGFKLAQCVMSQSGLQRIYLAPFDSSWVQTGITYNADCVITGMTSDLTFYAFDLLPETGGFNTPIPTSVQNAAQHYESTVELVIPTDNVVLRNTMKAVLAGPTLAIVELRANNDGLPGVNPTDGDLKFVGATMGCWALPASKNDAGKGSSDFRGWQISLMAKEPNPPYFIQDKSVFTWSY